MERRRVNALHGRVARCQRGSGRFDESGHGVAPLITRVCEYGKAAESKRNAARCKTATRSREEKTGAGRRRGG